MTTQSKKLLTGLIAASAAFVGCWLGGLPRDATVTAAITTLCAVYWVTEALPIPATSLIPFAALPLTGVLDHKQVANAYGHYLILLLLGGFILSKGIEQSGAHRRLALGMVRAFGGLGRRGLVLGFMAATALSSMWISNTATVLMLLPIAHAVLAADDGDDLTIPLLLGIAYAASIGGVGTPIGTPPNVVCVGIYAAQTGERISFLEWMQWGVPFVLVFVPVAWWWLTRRIGPGQAPSIPSEGAWRPAERRVLWVFAITAAAWILRTNPAGGWTAWLGLGETVDGRFRPSCGDDTVALAAVVAMFVLPNGEGDRLLTWDRAKEIPWGLLLLFGGGLSIAAAFQSSGLSDIVGEALRGVAGGPIILVTAAICLVVTFATELTSNTATTTLLMPILCSAGLAAGIEPRTLMVPAAISASCAFMMPVATAPNAVMFGTGEIPIRSMVRAGLVLNLIGAAIATAVCVAIL